MNTRLGLLFGLVIVQIVLIAGFWFGGGSQDNSESVLLDIDPQAITKIEISDSETSTLLRRDEQDWVVQYAGAEEEEDTTSPADTDKIATIIDKLAGLSSPWPVATSSASSTRFEVAEENFQRHVELYIAGDLAGDLYLGTSPGFQKVHVRRALENNVYSVALSNYELATDPDSWLDKRLLAVQQSPETISVHFRDETDRRENLSLSDEGWLINGDAANQETVTTYANRYKTLRVLGRAEKAAIENSNIIAEIETNSAGEVHRLSIFKNTEDEEGDYLVKLDTAPEYYRLATYVAEQLLMQDVDFAAASE
ncbi:MAG: DUF4340 domain-containing protein [Gammaproteobacteria bacterium]|nr:DUF4340 domain-containing protein [Gammaproteobacteria bacterium]